MAKSRTSFQPGHAGNPGGRPKVIAEVKELARLHTQSAIDALTEIVGNLRAPPAARVAAAAQILDRGYGRPTQHIEADVTIANALAERLAAARTRSADE